MWARFNELTGDSVHKGDKDMIQSHFIFVATLLMSFLPMEAAGGARAGSNILAALKIERLVFEQKFKACTTMAAL